MKRYELKDFKVGLYGVLKTVKNKYKARLHRIANKTHIGNGISIVKRHPRVIVSLTTYPERMGKVKVALEALLNQSTKPDKIVLNLAKDEIANAPYMLDNLSRYMRRGLDVSIADDNLRQYNKLIHSLREFPDDVIVTVDDDVLYSRKFIERLYSIHEYDPSAIVAYRYSYMVKKNKNSMCPYNDWPEVIKTDVSNRNMFFCGVGGVLYPPGSLHAEVLNSRLFMNLCPMNDDVWFNAMAILKGTRKRLASNRSMEFPSIGNVQEHSLYEINVVQGKNDTQIKNVFDHFGIYEYLK